MGFGLIPLAQYNSVSFRSVSVIRSWYRPPSKSIFWNIPSERQMSFWAIVFLGKCPSGQISSGQMSFWANVFLVKCLSGQMSLWSNVFWANVFMVKCLSGQMSFWANVVWANVLLGKCRIGKCLWANVSEQMSYGQMSPFIWLAIELRFSDQRGISAVVVRAPVLLKRLQNFQKKGHKANF
jgi:hypothetical protein